MMKPQDIIDEIRDDFRVGNVSMPMIDISQYQSETMSIWDFIEKRKPRWIEFCFKEGDFGRIISK